MDGDCSAVVFEVANNNANYLQLLNRYGLSFDDLSGGKTYSDDDFWGRRSQKMCVDIISNTATMNQLKMSSPVPLVQSYYECRLRWEATVASSLGSAAGSAQLYTTVAMMVIGFVFIRYIKHRRIKVSTTKDLEQKREILEEKKEGSRK